MQIIKEQLGIDEFVKNYKVFKYIIKNRKKKIEIRVFHKKLKKKKIAI